MPVSREIVEGEQNQGVDEEITYSLTTTNWGSSPSNASVKVYNITTGTKVDVTATTMGLTPTCTVNGDVITLPELKSLAALSLYRIEVKFDAGGNTFEAIIHVRGSE